MWRCWSPGGRASGIVRNRHGSSPWLDRPWMVLASVNGSSGSLAGSSRYLGSRGDGVFDEAVRQIRSRFVNPLISASFREIRLRVVCKLVAGHFDAKLPRSRRLATLIDLIAGFRCLCLFVLHDAPMLRCGVDSSDTAPLARLFQLWLRDQSFLSHLSPSQWRFARNCNVHILHLVRRVASAHHS